VKIYFVRHGGSLANTLHVISNRNLPHPLTEKGRAQVDQVAAALKGRPIERIYTSPVPRAVETAHIHAKALGVPFEVTDALREYDLGEYEGRGDEEAWSAHSRFIHAWLEGRDRDQAPAGGETFYDIQRRFVPFIEGLVRQFGGTQTEVLCVAHGGLYRVGLPLVLSNLRLEEVAHRGVYHTDIITAELQDSRLLYTSWECAGI
jgi:probable phosphoglycerate mutase